MRVLLISGTFPPDRCGVGDYTKHLAENLARGGGDEIAVLTGNAAAASDDPAVTIFCSTDGVICLRDARRVIRQFKPGIVHIQYPTARAISRWIPAFTGRVQRVPVIQTWHEHFSECGQLGPLNVLGLRGLIHVREDLPERLPHWLKRSIGDTELVFIPNGCTIPGARVPPADRESVKRMISGGKPIVAYFGFAHPNKDVHRLFEIADPALHHLLLVCELNESHAYQRRVLELIQSNRWREHTTVSGFVPPTEVSRLLACSDAIVFPFSRGVGRWHTSLKAALASGTFVVGTTLDPAQVGYSSDHNLCLVPCGDLGALKQALATYLGRRREPDTSNEWIEIAEAHRQIYARLLSHG